MPEPKGSRRANQATADSTPPANTESNSTNRTVLPGAKSSPPASKSSPPASKSSPTGKPAKPKAVVELPPELVALGKFEAKRKLGEGGMGAVFLARHTFLDRLVAIKVMSGAAIGHDQARDRFLSEMKAGGKLNHPNIAQTIDAAAAGDILFMVMEFIEGVSLDRQVAGKGPLSKRLACNCIIQAAKGLQHAFEKGMVHRDIKPANLMILADRTVKVLDFGLARLPTDQGETRKTAFQTFMGTADYVSPEQAKDARSADIRSDIYSLGATLYFLLSGKPPFKGDTVYEVAAAHITQPPEPLDNVPEELWAVIAKMMAKKPKDRFQTPQEVVEALTPFTVKSESADESNAEVETVSPRQNDKPGKRRGSVWLFAGLGVGGVGVLAAAVWALVTFLPGGPGKGQPDVAAVIPPPPPATASEVAPKVADKVAEAAAKGPGLPPLPLTKPNDPPPFVPVPSKKDADSENRVTSKAKQQEDPVPEPPKPVVAKPDPEQVKEKLEKAKEEFEKEKTRLSNKLIAAMEAEIKYLEKARKRTDQANTEEELKKFKIVGIPPKMPGLKNDAQAYTKGLDRARTDLEEAYQAAIKDFNAAGDPSKARHAQEDLDELRKEAAKMSSTQPGKGKSTKKGKSGGGGIP